MKKHILILSFFICFALSLSSKERVLLVGIGDYPPVSGWQIISSKNDVELLKGVLPKEAIITTLVNQAATHEGIIQAIGNLIDASQPGDTVLIHFSCHGQQMLMEGMNDEPDYLDESLVPYDAFMKKSSNYHGENHLKDDELGEYLTNLRKKVGSSGLVIVTLDACYSDSMNRDAKNDSQTKYRGGADIFGANSITKEELEEIVRNRKTSDSLEIEKFEDAADIVMLSACKSYQRNMETVQGGTGYGSLSYAMYIGFNTYPLNRGDIKAWLDCVLKEMNNLAFTQTPQVRSTLPIELPPVTPPSSQSSPSPTFNTLVGIIIAVIVLVIVVSFLLWKMSTRKSHRKR